MFSLKITGAVLIGVCCSLYGFLLSERLKQREKELSLILEGTRKLKTGFVYETKEIKNLLSHCYSSAGFLKFTGEEVNIKQNHLKKEDLEIISSFFENCGKSVRAEEIKKCEAFESRIIALQKSAKYEFQKNSKVFITFGICVGTAFAVVII